MPEAEQTIDSDYEEIGWYTFDDIDVDRWMSWEGPCSFDLSGPSRISIGTNGVVSVNYDTDKPQQDVHLPPGWYAVVCNAKFKLVLGT
ncbi:predicted protein [Sclerotinia sclerotiorum 1980 UF-70]|uniref:Uncharacterized protein n=2 Tax=Sclerotinia sclerotiorum (strain ATCC 18683 / 1980 / Ss-1) TaxID=665079 RepID=A7EAY0_SCLS1|nr:predicted protein [Sclerotinia sclerotiorum 1980 UF-70]APA08713.1 hypothetical protein sscle_04g034830 [Sclerotinia sclerotiorum 1980 UF-70]EDN99608.1 predicted protein [Sclerotinia sclerotiorum 1980 UF-70]